MRRVRILWIYLERYFLQWFAWRSFAFTLMVNQAVTPLISLAVWTAALPSRTQLSTYYVGVLFVKLLTVSYENHTFSTRIFSGDIETDLLRPHPVVLQPIGENLAIRIWHLLLALPIFVALSLFVSLHLTVANLALMFPALILAALLQFQFTFTLALSGFWTGRASSIVGIGSTMTFLLGGEAVPVSLMPTALQPLCQCLPFSGMLGFPAGLLSGDVHGFTILDGFISQVVWIVVFGIISTLSWKFGVRQYTSVGA